MDMAVAIIISISFFLLALSVSVTPIYLNDLTCSSFFHTCLLSDYYYYIYSDQDY